MHDRLSTGTHVQVLRSSLFLLETYINSKRRTHISSFTIRPTLIQIILCGLFLIDYLISTAALQSTRKVEFCFVWLLVLIS